MARQDRHSVYDLVSFAQPPVAEVALTLQFAPDTIDIEAFGLFAHRLRDEFPERQRQPVLPAMSEPFDQLAGVPSISFQFTDPASLPRLWLIRKDQTELVQVQHDRLTYNWRRIDENAAYPRYKKLRARLSELLSLLTECSQDAKSTGATGKSPPLAVNLCEVAYVNPIDYASTGSKAKAHPELSRILNLVRAPVKGAFLPDPEDTQFQTRWRVPGATLGRADGPVGRLHLSAMPALKPPEQTPIYMINLTARVLPTSPSPKNVMQALDVGHEWVVLGFKDVTTQEAQIRWGIDEEKPSGRLRSK